MDEKYYKAFRDSYLIDDIKSAYTDLSENMNSIKTKEEKKEFIIVINEYGLSYICIVIFLFVILLFISATAVPLYYGAIKNRFFIFFILALFALTLFWIIVLSTKVHFANKLSHEFNVILNN